MSKNDDPGRDKPRPADFRPGERQGPTRPGDARPGDPRKPHATLDLKATEVGAEKGASKDATKSDAVTGTGPASSTTATASAMSATKPADTTAAAGKSEPGKTDTTGANDRKTTSSYAGTSYTTKPASATSGKTPAVTVARSGGGFGRFLTHMAAGLVGGLLTLFGLDALSPQFGILSGSTSPGTYDLGARVKALETRGGGAGDLAQKLADSEARLARLEESAKGISLLTESSTRLASETKALQEKLGQGDAGQRIAKLEDILSTLSAAAQTDQPGRIAQLAAVSSRLKELEGIVTTQTNALRRDLTQSMETRAQQAGEAGEAARSATQRIDRDMSAVKTDTARLTQRMEALKADGDRLGQTLRVVQEETGAIRSAVDGIKGDVEARLRSVAKPTDVSEAVAPVASKLASLEQGLQGVVKSEEDRRSNAERIVLALELANLKRVVDRGTRYAPELAEVKKAAGGKADLVALERFKEQGVPTLADLTRDFRPVANAIIDADTEPADGTMVERLRAGAKSIVRVRKVDHKPGDNSAEAIVGRMEIALKEGRLGNAIDEVKSLQPRAAAVTRDWLDKVEARHSVDRALSAVESQLKSSLAGAAGKAQN